MKIQPWDSRSKSLLFRASLATASCVLMIVAGCAGHQGGEIELPSADQFSREQLVFHSDFRLPRRHRLVDELAARRVEISDSLMLPMSDEPINVYLFKNESRFREFMRRRHPRFPERRAFFVKNDTTLSVFAFWGRRVAEDLRHEVAHGYLHAVVPNLPLWLDEGLAEYYEVSRGQNGVNRQHVLHLLDEVQQGDWKPDLKRLESIEDADKFYQLDYAESWLWTHFLLESDDTRKLVQDQLARLRMTGEAEPLSDHVAEDWDELNQKLLAHLAQVATEL